MIRVTNSERDGRFDVHGTCCAQGAGRARSDRSRLHYLDPEPEMPPAWLGIGLALILAGCIVVVAWTAIVVSSAWGV